MVLCEQGELEIAKWLAGESASTPTHLGVGTNVGSKSTTHTIDTTKGGEVGLDITISLT